RLEAGGRGVNDDAGALVDGRVEIGAEPAAGAVNQHTIEGETEAAARGREKVAVRIEGGGRQERILTASGLPKIADVTLDTEHNVADLPIVAGLSAGGEAAYFGTPLGAVPDPCQPVCCQDIGGRCRARVTAEAPADIETSPGEDLQRRRLRVQIRCRR